MNMKKIENGSQRHVLRATTIAALLLAMVATLTAVRATHTVPAAGTFYQVAAADYRTWAHDSVGVTSPSTLWYLAEGCTAGDF
ncbi:MAG: hypothetical protein JW854_15535, partial [Actinobacteria bacterium]|nr:hypothetical protein [Actinomycetota bacterium]